MKIDCYQSLLKSTCLVAVTATLGLTSFPASAKQALPDEDVVKAAKLALKENPLTASIKPEVKVEKGVITLTGYSESLPIKNLASETLGTVVGVKAIVNELEIREIDRSDEQIQQDIDRLFSLNYRDRNKAVKFRSSDGVVTLNGAVSSPAVSRLAEKMASSVVGVRSVVNLLRISPDTERSDEETRQVIALKLKGNPWVDQDLVKVEVDQGVVSFHGAVDSMNEKSQLIQLAEMRGVTVRADNLVVSPELRSPMERPHRPMFLSDTGVKNSLLEAYRQHPRLEQTNIDVDVTDGDITLAGSVYSIGEKSIAERIAVDLPGAEYLYSFISIEKDTNISDHDWETSIEQLFRSDSILSDSDIGVTVNQGLVTLTGTVDSAFVRRQAMKMVRNTRGVQQVRSALRINWNTPEAYSDSQ